MIPGPPVHLSQINCTHLVLIKGSVYQQYHSPNRILELLVEKNQKLLEVGYKRFRYPSIGSSLLSGLTWGISNPQNPPLCNIKYYPRVLVFRKGILIFS